MLLKKYTVSLLFISSVPSILQHSVSDMSKLFSHENHPFPPSLSDYIKLRLGKKSDLMSVLSMQWLSKWFPRFYRRETSWWSCCSTPSLAVIFQVYADPVFGPHVLRQLEKSKLGDVVWNTFIRSITEITRERLRARTIFRVTVQHCYRIIRINMNYLHFFPRRLSLYIALTIRKHHNIWCLNYSSRNW